MLRAVVSVLPDVVQLVVPRAAQALSHSSAVEFHSHLEGKAANAGNTVGLGAFLLPPTLMAVVTLLPLKLYKKYFLAVTLL